MAGQGKSWDISNNTNVYSMCYAEIILDGIEHRVGNESRDRMHRNIALIQNKIPVCVHTLDS